MGVHERSHEPEIPTHQKWVPVITQDTSVWQDFADPLYFAVYWVIGKLVFFRIHTQYCLNTGTVGSPVKFTLPVPAAYWPLQQCGTGQYAHVISNIETIYPVQAYILDQTHCGFARTDVTNPSVIGYNPNVAFDVADSFQLQGWYPAELPV